MTRKKSPHTERAYQGDWTLFETFCSAKGLTSFPAHPTTVAKFLVDRGKKDSWNTMKRRLSSISTHHKERGEPSPAEDARVRKTMQASPAKAKARVAPKFPSETALLEQLIKNCSATVHGARQKALMLLAFCGAMTRSELSNLWIEDISLCEEGLVIEARKGGDRLSHPDGRPIGIPYGKYPHLCPVRAVLEWKGYIEEDTGPLFRSLRKDGSLTSQQLSDRSIGALLKEALIQCGANPSEVSAFSFRLGLVHSAAKQGASLEALQNQTGIKSLSHLDRYRRTAILFTKNAAKIAGI